jgi:TusE/DsrC/DsvC family sulfur relay protein
MVSSAGTLDKLLFPWDGPEVEVDEDGFIQQPEVWNEHLALALAQTDGVAALTDSHWKIIQYIRGYYQEFEIAPMIRKLCKETGFTLREIYDLFPSGPAKGACKVAGLPKPTGCV